MAQHEIKNGPCQVVVDDHNRGAPSGTRFQLFGSFIDFEEKEVCCIGNAAGSALSNATTIEAIENILEIPVLCPDVFNFNGSRYPVLLFSGHIVVVPESLE